MPEEAEKRQKLKLYLLFIPVAYFSFLFHEFGHWTIGEILGNDMALTLNLAWPSSGHYVEAGNYIWVISGGPVFSILQSFIALLVVLKYRTVFAYPFLFFPLFMRFFSLTCGGFSKQDEAGMSAFLGIGTYTVAAIVILILVCLVWAGSKKLRINLKTNSYYLTMSTLSILLVIWTDKLIS
jgi:hypothetical protein